MSDEKANTVSSKTLTILSLCVFIAVAAYLGVPVKLGYLDLPVYQLPAFLLLRYVSAQRIAVPALALLAVLSFYADFPIGVYAEVLSFLVLLFAIDGFASSGRAEHRLVVTLCAVLLVCFPLYTATLTFFREDTLLLAAAHASTFVFSTVFAVVFAELLWAVSTIIHKGFFQEISRHDHGGRVSIRSLGTVFISVLVVIIFFVFLQIWSARWETVLSSTTQDLVDQSAQAQLNNDMHQLELEVRSASIRFRESNTPWLFIGERYLLVGMDPEDNHDAVSSPQLVGSDRMDDPIEMVDLLDEQMSTFRYRANMGIDFARLRSPLFLDFNEQKFPVYSSTLAPHRGNTFSSFLMFLVERDQPVKITNVTINSNGSSQTTPDNGRSAAANFSAGEFGGATVDSKDEIYTFEGEDWAGWANDADIYPLEFPGESSITFTASADVPTHVYFKFEYRVYPYTTPEFFTKPVLVDSRTLTEYTVTFGEQILFLVDTLPLGLNRSQNAAQTGVSLRRISASDKSILPEDVRPDHIIDSRWMGGTLWNASSTNPNALSRLGALNRHTMLSVPISETLASAFELQLPSTDLIVADLKVWPRLQVFFRATTTMAIFFAASVLFTSMLTMFLVGLLIKPITRLLSGLEELKHMHIEMGDSNTAIEPLKIESKALSVELNNLQDSIVWFSKEVAAADHQLRSAVTGYEALLSSLPLGVMEIDRDYQLRFRNDAMSQITGDSAEASYRLRLRAEQLFESGETLDEYALSLEDQPQRNLLLAITPRKNEAGEDSGFWLLVTDLTKQKAMDSQLLQTAKLATLGEMSTGMAHELNQPLNIIRLALSNLTNSVKKGRATEESIMSRLERMDSAVDRAAVIIDHMRAFGRVAGEDFAPFSMSSSIKEAVNLVREPLAVKGVELVNEVQEPVLVLGNTIQFEQVLLNMINNARDAILQAAVSGVITLRQYVEQSQVTLTIEDTGGGIPAEALPHIFEPFFTTKEVGKGTGLGGSISFGIIQDMQGNIWAENTGQGARISIRLPIYSEEQVSSGDE